MEMKNKQRLERMRIDLRNRSSNIGVVTGYRYLHSICRWRDICRVINQNWIWRSVLVSEILLICAGRAVKNGLIQRFKEI